MMRNGARSRGWAVVTGASSGIGLELARGLAARGYSLVVVARRTHLLETLAEELSSTYRTRVEIRTCDLADRAQRTALTRELVSLDVVVLCTNAGFPICGAVLDNDPAREAAAVEVNVVSMHELTLAILPGMVARRSGAILVTGSNAGEHPVPTAATYAATKAFVNTFAESLHIELVGTGVSCTLLEPGPVRTEFTKVGGIEGSEKNQWMGWKTPASVAAAAIKAMERRRRVVIPGPLAKMQAYGGRYLPRTLLFPIIKTVILPRLREDEKPSISMRKSRGRLRIDR
jgi:uncharacterized protein